MHLRTINNSFSIRKWPIELVKGSGYMYFVLDDGKLYDTRSIMVPRVNDLSLERWLEEAKEFLLAKGVTL
jgi:hypothetical protein